MTPAPEQMRNSGRKAAAEPVIVSCNGAACTGLELLSLDYRPTAEPAPNVKIGLPGFVRGVYHLPDRLLDLLEIAAYVYCADRLVRRGQTDAVEHHAWSRSFQFFVRVRDNAFWQQPAVCRKLDGLLTFLSGNRQMKFCFQAGHFTSPTNLFDSEEFALEGCGDEKVVLFSGGVDSLAGIVGDLCERETKLCLVSHRSGQPSIRKTQRQLLKALGTRYPGRVRPYGFDCHLIDKRAVEETQRTRFFLYTVIAFVLARSMGSQAITVFENGVTSLNLPKRQDMMHGRASRTTHPKTITLLRQFFSLVADARFDIITPFAWKTKADVMEVLRNCGGSDLLSSSVSCSKTFKVGNRGTHCGRCSQCVDRRFAAFSSGMDDYDECGLYSHDFLTESVTDAEAKTTLLDYLRQACVFAGCGLDQFYTARASDLSDIVDHLDGMCEEEAVEAVWSLCNRHGSQVIGAVRRMRESLRAAGIQPPGDSALPMINEEAHTKELQLVREADSAPHRASTPGDNIHAALLTTRGPVLDRDPGGKCPVCENQTLVGSKQCYRSASEVLLEAYQCRICGLFALLPDVWTNPRHKAVPHHMLAAYARQQNARRLLPPLFVPRGCVLQHASFATVSFADVAAAFPMAVHHRLDRTLLNLVDQYPTWGEVIEVSAPYDYPLSYSEDENGFRLTIAQLHEDGYVDATRPTREGPILKEDGSGRIVISVKGFMRAQAVAHPVIEEPSKVETEFTTRTPQAQPEPSINNAKDQVTSHPAQGTKLAARESRPEQGDKDAVADVAIVTALPKELDAVIRHLSRHAEVHITQEGNRTYHRCTTKSGLTVVAAVALDMGQLNAALLVRDLVDAWKPREVLLVGIAAGIGKDIRLGDVVVSEQIVDYEAGKVTAKGTELRWQVYRSDASLLDRAVNFRDRTWVGEIAVERPDGDRQANPRIHRGVVLSGNKVIADADATGELKDVWSRALAVEMEATGAAAAIYQMANGPKFIMVKGVCDRADAGKDDRWQEYAADVAAAFTAAFVGLKVQP